LRVLIVEDDHKLAGFIRDALCEQNHAVDIAHDGEEGWILAGTEGYDIIVLDIMLPKRSGFDVLRDIRQKNSTVPVLLLTARDSVTDKVAGLDLGADDYLTKPFSLKELLARIRALSRRHEGIKTQKLSCGDLVIDENTHKVFRGESEINLTAKEYSVLCYLMLHQGKVVTHTELIEEVWGMTFDMFSDVVKVVISRLRKKLEDNGEGALINTVRGVGYIMADPEDGA